MSEALRAIWTQGQRREGICYAIGGLLILSGLVHLAILIATHGSWEGPLSLRKPGTFGLSFGLTLISIAWVTSFLRISSRARTLLLAAFAAACVFETLLISMQAWRGVPSHFNVETPFDAVVARLLAAGGVALIAIIVAFTIASCRANPAVPISLRVAVRVGFATLVGSLMVGGIMIARGMSLVFSGHPQAAYATAGALKPTHAMTMHGILVLPALAWLLSFSGWSEERRLRLVTAACAGYLVIVVVVVVENLLSA